MDLNGSFPIRLELPLRFFQQRHVMGDAHRHLGFLSLLLDEAPLDAEIVVAEQAISAEAGLG